MDENSQDGLQQQGPHELPEGSVSRFGRGRWDLVVVLACIVAGLVGAFSSRLLWRGGEDVATDVAPDATPDVAADVEVQKPPESPAAEEPAGGGAKFDSPLPTTAAPLLEEVREVIERLVATFPNDLDCLEMKARFQKWTGKSDEAIKTWEECLALNPGYAHAYLGMAEAAARKGEHEKAADLASKSMQTAPRLFQARAVLAEALVNLGRPEEAIVVLEEFLQTDRRSYGYFLLGRAYTLMEQLEKAKENYQASIRKYPEYAEAYYGLSRVCVRLGERDAARESMATYRKLMAARNPGRQGVDMTPESFEMLCTNAAIIYTDMGRIYLVHEQPDEAERLCRRAAGLSSENIECRQALAWLSRSKGKTAETIRWLEEVAILDTKDPTYWLEIGNLRISLSQFEPAEAAFQKARAMAPQDARGHAALAALYLERGQRIAESLTLAQTAVDLAPTAENYAILATACQRNGDDAAAAAAREQAAQRTPPVGKPD